ncbi:hypothetical protein KXQ82_17815 [Mucilaginibacter sp. HMF5004]|uniref:hypothetical protein n=1 Tax=Mucilaginibacter rivuli TaxID=2857527 RepID=UPI001C60134A|nr:hypothetical protein [Mucilaginibacter rivuli]MBW4891588.1 hypothetical protein [Mucilaginibacter rivuli]
MSGSIFDDISDGREVSLDFDSLRNYGIELIQKLAGDTWTDYNLHDPGVTILEALCYAITDLAYQTDFDITDLLSDQKGDIHYRANSFFDKQKILTTNPVTVTDYRKVIIDEVDEVENAWVTPLTSENAVNAISGLYKIVVQLTDRVAKGWTGDNAAKKKIINSVKASFVKSRNLCEDVADITILKPVKLSIKAEIQIDAIVVPEVALANIYDVLQKAVNRPIKYSIERELLQKGYTIDEIYTGPALKNGIITDTDLKERQLVIDANDLIQTISGVQGVLFTKSLVIARDGTDNYTKKLKLDETEVAFITIDTDQPFDISLIVDKYRIAIRKNLLKDIYQNIVKTGNKAFVQSLQKVEQIKGTYRDATTYYSIQNYFPYVYGIGPGGLPSTATVERKAQAKQLKGYLMLFEQVLANYQAQVHKVDKLFSNEKDNLQSYFTNTLYNVPGANSIIAGYNKKEYPKDGDGWNKFKADPDNDYVAALNTTTEPDYVRTDRKNRMTDHLMARFNEVPVVYPVTLYAMLYHNSRKTERITSEIIWKSSVLRDFDKINYNRIRGVNYLVANDDEYNFSSKMRKLLYIINKNKHSLTSVFDPGRVKFEMRPDKGNAGNGAETHVVDETAWNPEMQKLTLSKQEFAQLKKDGKIDVYEPKYSGSFVFPNKDISVLKYAININNYRIAQEANGAYMLLYKAPTEERWSILSRFSGGAVPTVEMLESLTKYLIGISTGSEGFYLIEHILLRPDPDIKVYGFNFYDKDNNIIFENGPWLTFGEREQAIKRLLQYDAGKGFRIAQKNREMAAANVSQLNNAVLWNKNTGELSIDKIDFDKTDIDRIAGLVKDAEMYLKQAEGLVKSAGAVHGQEHVKHSHVTKDNIHIAQSNLSIAVRICKEIKLLAGIADNLRKADDIRFSVNSRVKALNDYSSALNDYWDALDSLLITAKHQQYLADSNAVTINNHLIESLSQIGKMRNYTGDKYTNLAQLFNSIKAYGTKSYPRLKMLIKGDGSNTINEDFFSFTISVIFPEWPARFQDTGFKACVESLFKYHAPANIKINIKWLSIKKMKRFEPLYSTWKQNLLTNNNNYGAQHIIAFLLKEDEQ